MFFNIHEKNREGLVDFHDIMDVVCNDAHWHVLFNTHAYQCASSQTMSITYRSVIVEMANKFLVLYMSLLSLSSLLREPVIPSFSLEDELGHYVVDIMP